MRIEVVYTQMVTIEILVWRTVNNGKQKIIFPYSKWFPNMLAEDPSCNTVFSHFHQISAISKVHNIGLWHPNPAPLEVKNNRVSYYTYEQKLRNKNSEETHRKFLQMLQYSMGWILVLRHLTISWRIIFFLHVADRQILMRPRRHRTEVLWENLSFMIMNVEVKQGPGLYHLTSTGFFTSFWILISIDWHINLCKVKELLFRGSYTGLTN